jgi:choline dehydrogenase-like flavoprotein
MIADAVEMLEAAGAKNVKGRDGDGTLGRGIHEMGTARMGKDPKTSVLNKWNQVWDCMNVFVTDGSCMTSAACQNPSLTYMALTARAADYAVKELKKGNL